MSAKETTLPVLNFGHLVGAIRQVHDELAAQASRAVNARLTLRNWMIGYHVEEYERRGVDRTEYGDKLMDRLADSLTQLGVSRCDRREIYRYRQFYLAYPQIVEAVTPQFAHRRPRTELDSHIVVGYDNKTWRRSMPVLNYSEVKLNFFV